MDIISSLLMVPFFFLWIFLIVWLVKPKYFPFFKQTAIPSRWTVLGITAVIYIILLIMLILTLDTSAAYDEASVTDADLIAVLFSILSLVMLGFWSKHVANRRNKTHSVANEPFHQLPTVQIADDQIADDQKHYLIIKIAQLIADLHQRGQYHGDINPNTIMMDDDSAFDTDTEHTDANFLLAHLTLAEPTDFSSNKLKKSSNKDDLAVVGHPAYQAPERWQGQEATEQSDIYAFGIVLYEILTGKLPFTIDELSGDPMLDWNNQHCLTPIPKLPPEYQPYQRVINNALAKQRKKRYQSMQEAIIDLQSLKLCQ